MRSLFSFLIAKQCKGVAACYLRQSKLPLLVLAGMLSECPIASKKLPLSKLSKSSCFLGTRRDEALPPELGAEPLILQASLTALVLSGCQ